MSKILCPHCQKNEAVIHPQYGVIWCDDCNKKLPVWHKGYPEFVPDSVKEDRKKYFKSALQPFRGGELSREYVKAYGTKGIKVSPDQVRKAKDVWRDLPGHKHWEKSF
jgi:hypothetical protein